MYFFNRAKKHEQNFVRFARDVHLTSSRCSVMSARGGARLFDALRLRMVFLEGHAIPDVVAIAMIFSFITLSCGVNGVNGLKSHSPDARKIRAYNWRCLVPAFSNSRMPWYVSVNPLIPSDNLSVLAGSPPPSNFRQFHFAPRAHLSTL